MNIWFSVLSLNELTYVKDLEWQSEYIYKVHFYYNNIQVFICLSMHIFRIFVYQYFSHMPTLSDWLQSVPSCVDMHIEREHLYLQLDLYYLDHSEDVLILTTLLYSCMANHDTASHWYLRNLWLLIPLTPWPYSCLNLCWPAGLPEGQAGAVRTPGVRSWSLCLGAQVSLFILWSCRWGGVATAATIGSKILPRQHWRQSL